MRRKARRSGASRWTPSSRPSCASATRPRTRASASAPTTTGWSWKSGPTAPSRRTWPWSKSAKILRKHLNPFVQQFELGVGTAGAGGRRQPGAHPAGSRRGPQRQAGPADQRTGTERALLALPGKREYPHRRRTGRLYDEERLLQVRNFGRTSLEEVKKKLGELGLTLGHEDRRRHPRSCPSRRRRE